MLKLHTFISAFKRMENVSFSPLASFVHSTFDGLLNPCFVFGVVKCKSFGNIERSILIVQIKHTLGRYIKQGLNRDQGWYWSTSTFEAGGE